MRRLKLVIEYDGSHYHGWQRQPKDITIQETIEKALEKITLKKINLFGAGRTDSGVHATGQVAHCELETDMSNEKLTWALNGNLPKDITIKKIETVESSFHAQFNALSKIYRYQILNTASPSALYRNFSWWIHHDLNIDVMNQAAKVIIGTHDFKAFQNTGTDVSSTIRTIEKSIFEIKSPFLVYEIQGNGFLKQMVRNLVGTFVSIGKGHMTLERFHEILEGKDRTQVPKAAPPQGLFLEQVFH